MSKIDAYKRAAALAGSLRKAADHALGKDSPNNDKHTATCHFHGISNASFRPMQMEVRLEYGYYGSSSGYSATSEEMGRRLATAITARMPALLADVLAAAEKEAEAARKAAEDEARAVLADTLVQS